MERTVNVTDVCEMLVEALPEFREAVEAHQNDWPDDPMLYVLVGALFQRMVDMPEGPERRDFVRRGYALTETMLTSGTPSVCDCFAIEMIEPLAGDPRQQLYPGLETAVGDAGRKELGLMREWSRLYRGMKAALDRINRQIGRGIFEGPGIDVRNASARIVVDVPRWNALTEKQKDDAYDGFVREWKAVSGRSTGVEVVAPRVLNFRLLRG